MSLPDTVIITLYERWEEFAYYDLDWDGYEEGSPLSLLGQDVARFRLWLKEKVLGGSMFDDAYSYYKDVLEEYHKQEKTGQGAKKGITRKRTYLYSAPSKRTYLP